MSERVLPHPSQPVIAPLPPSENPYLARFIDKAEKGPRVTANISTTIPKVDRPNELAAVLRVLNDSDDDDAVRNEAINLLRRSGYTELTKQLIQILNNPKEHERFRSFAVQFLGLRLAEGATKDERAQIIDRLLGSMSDSHRAVRREALMALLAIKHDAALSLLAGGLSDPRWTDARDLIIRGLFENNDMNQVSAIRPFAYDNDVSVRIAAIYVLGQWHDDSHSTHPAPTHP